MSANRDMRLPNIGYTAFPFTIGPDGAKRAGRLEHIRQQVEQVLFTGPGERVFRPEFGFGARMFVFEPNAAALWDVVRNRLYGSLSEALSGEVDPKTIRIEAGADPVAPERLLIQVSYVLAAIQKEEVHTFPV